jgi:hypothetical protein
MSGDPEDHDKAHGERMLEEHANALCPRHRDEFNAPGCSECWHERRGSDERMARIDALVTAMVGASMAHPQSVGIWNMDAESDRNELVAFFNNAHAFAEAREVSRARFLTPPQQEPGR